MVPKPIYIPYYILIYFKCGIESITIYLETNQGFFFYLCIFQIGSGMRINLVVHEGKISNLTALLE